MVLVFVDLGDVLLVAQGPIFDAFSPLLVHEAILFFSVQLLQIDLNF